MSIFTKIELHSHKNHNPECDIILGYLDQDSMITYGIYIKGDNKGQEFLEIYRGANYVPGSTRRSYSKLLVGFNIKRSEYYALWLKLKLEYEKNYRQ